MGEWANGRMGEWMASQARQAPRLAPYVDAYGRLPDVALGIHRRKARALKVRFNVWHKSHPTIKRDIRMPTVPIEPRFQR